MLFRRAGFNSRPNLRFVWHWCPFSVTICLGTISVTVSRAQEKRRRKRGYSSKSVWNIAESFMKKYQTCNYNYSCTCKAFESIWKFEIFRPQWRSAQVNRGRANYSRPHIRVFPMQKKLKGGKWDLFKGSSISCQRRWMSNDVRLHFYDIWESSMKSCVEKRTQGCQVSH